MIDFDTARNIQEATHHRVISATLMSEIDDKIAQWLEIFGNALKHGLVEA